MAFSRLLMAIIILITDDGSGCSLYTEITVTRYFAFLTLFIGPFFAYVGAMRTLGMAAGSQGLGSGR